MRKTIALIIVAVLLLIGVIALLVGIVRHVSASGQRVALPTHLSGSSGASSLLAEAKDAESRGQLIEAKNEYQQLVNNYSNSPEVMSWQKKAEELNIRLIFSPTITAKSIPYEVKPGDSLTKIAKEHKTTVELLRRSNGIVKDMITPGQKLKVWTAPFSILVDKSQNILMLKADDEVIKTYTVSTGANNSSPVGTFKIVNKLPNPTWFKAGAVVPASSPENVLGSRWMGFDLAGFGIHGTTDPQSLGKQVTQGCVRLSNSDVEELYDLIPLGTEVTIVD